MIRVWIEYAARLLYSFGVWNGICKRCSHILAFGSITARICQLCDESRPLRLSSRSLIPKFSGPVSMSDSRRDYRILGQTLLTSQVELLKVAGI